MYRRDHYEMLGAVLAPKSKEQTDAVNIHDFKQEPLMLITNSMLILTYGYCKRQLLFYIFINYCTSNPESLNLFSMQLQQDMIV